MEELLKLILSEIQDVKISVNRMEKKLDATFDQVVRNSESQTITKNELNTHEHSIAVLNKRLFSVESEIQSIKYK